MNWFIIERRSSAAAGEDGFEGTVSRKHEWESTTKKASNRSWDKVYLVLRNGELAAYKVSFTHFSLCCWWRMLLYIKWLVKQDQKSARSTPEAHYRGEAPIDVRTAVAEVAGDYTKKRHVFRLK